MTFHDHIQLVQPPTFKPKWCIKATRVNQVGFARQLSALLNSETLSASDFFQTRKSLETNENLRDAQLQDYYLIKSQTVTNWEMHLKNKE